MSLQISHPEVESLLQELVSYTGETVQQAIANSVKERLVREKAKTTSPSLLSDELLRIGRECAALPVLDNRTPDEMLGYDQVGLPA